MSYIFWTTFKQLYIVRPNFPPCFNEHLEETLFRRAHTHTTGCYGNLFPSIHGTPCHWRKGNAWPQRWIVPSWILLIPLHLICQRRSFIYWWLCSIWFVNLCFTLIITCTMRFKKRHLTHHNEPIQPIRHIFHQSCGFSWLLLYGCLLAHWIFSKYHTPCPNTQSSTLKLQSPPMAE